MFIDLSSKKFRIKDANSSQLLLPFPDLILQIASFQNAFHRSGWIFLYFLKFIS